LECYRVKGEAFYEEYQNALERGFALWVVRLRIGITTNSRTK
jgi:hypothetical protein